MKLFLIGIFTITSLCSSAQTNERIRVIFGTRSHPASDGKGCEGDKGLCLIFTTRDKVFSPGMGVADIQEINGRIEFRIVQDPSPATSAENTFYVYEDKELPVEIAEEMGYRQVIVKKGEYPLDKRDNRYGTILLNALFR